MKIVIASYGSRGDIEPCSAVGRELLRRGHDVCMAVPPNLLELVESDGLEAVSYGRDSQTVFKSDFLQNLWKGFPGNLKDRGELLKSWRETRELVEKHWPELNDKLVSLARGSDLLLSGLIYEQLAANVAEYYNIPFATLHTFPLRPNGHWIPGVPPTVTRCGMRMFDWMNWLGTRSLEATQRSQLGLPNAKGPSPRRIAEQKSLEIQAYDELCFPGLAAEWEKWKAQRPFVGALTMDAPTDGDEDVASFIAAGTPPIYFGFGSIPAERPDETIAMISTACAELGERALVCSGWSNFKHAPHADHVKIVRAVNLSAVFRTCRAVVHHGGLGTMAAGLRAGVPALILWSITDGQIAGLQLKRLKVGTARRFSSSTSESLVADLRQILAPEYVSRAREIASWMTTPRESAANAADVLEIHARRGIIR
ncbi:glycosyltransferase [Mycobacterium sp. NPDC051804]|uniref:glycosyltransferase n=1 Tax=Mycobacterium sp. NPDC051804 TaxID=3364295 RepID=UPI003793A1A5